MLALVQLVLTQDIKGTVVIYKQTKKLSNFILREKELLSDLQNKPIYKPNSNKLEEFELNEESGRYLEPTPKFPVVKGENEPMLVKKDVRYSEV